MHWQHGWVGYFALVFAAILPSTKSSVITNDPNSVANKTYDFVIVGGGTAGLTLARRLSEDHTVTVLVVEAGGDDRTDPRVYNPYNTAELYGSSLDWSYATEQNRTIDAGKTLGGSSSINGMSWTRAAQAQYDVWSDLLDPQDASLNWNWKSMFAYMKKSEHFHKPTSSELEKGATFVPSVHGSQGPVQAAYPKLMFGGPQQSAFVETMVNLGIKRGQDLSTGQPNVVSLMPNSINPTFPNDTRSSSATAYLSPVENITENWTTLIGQQVTKVLFAPRKHLPRIATGVQYSTNSSTHFTAYAKREVIVSAGAIGSPALLQHSGIGDPKLLVPLGVEVQVNISTVGRNLQEQTLVPQSAAGTDFDADGDGPADIIAFPNIYQLFGANATSTVHRIKASIPAWARSQASSAYSAPALEKIFSAQASLIIDKKVPLSEILFTSGATSDIKLVIESWNLLPFSRGNVSIQTSDPFVKPRVLVNYFNVDIDLDIQIQTQRFGRVAFQTPPLSNLSLGETNPGYAAVPDDSNHGSSQDWATYIKGIFFANSHAIATCAMMSRSLGGVVDGHLRVYDTKNLRVVDASIIPLQLSAHISSSVYGLAEKAADLIKQGL